MIGPSKIIVELPAVTTTKRMDTMRVEETIFDKPTMREGQTSDASKPAAIVDCKNFKLFVHRSFQEIALPFLGALLGKEQQFAFCQIVKNSSRQQRKVVIESEKNVFTKGKGYHFCQTYYN